MSGSASSRSRAASSRLSISVSLSICWATRWADVLAGMLVSSVIAISPSSYASHAGPLCRRCGAT
eukprot:6757610-Prymnesium_polylepis.1